MVSSSKAGRRRREVNRRLSRDILHPTLDRYHADDIYNLDETALFWKLLPDKTFAFKGERCSGGKKSRERATVMLCCNMSGVDKRKPVVIGKHAKPRCFKHIKAGLPVQYYSNASAWMTNDIFKDWIMAFDRDMTRQNRRVLLVMDNCSSHKVPDLRSVEVLFLPPNATAKLQPCDAGIICNVKVHYRKAMVLNLLADIEGGRSDHQASLLDAIHMLTQSWEKVTADTIANCFLKAGFCHSSDDQRTSESVSTDQELVEPLLTRLFQEWNVPRSDYFTVDDEVLTEDPTAAPDGAAAPCTSSVPDSDESSEEEDLPHVFSKEAMVSANVIRKFCIQSGNGDLVKSFSAFKDKLVYHIEISKKQTCISDFCCFKGKDGKRGERAMKTETGERDTGRKKGESDIRGEGEGSDLGEEGIE